MCHISFISLTSTQPQVLHVVHATLPRAVLISWSELWVPSDGRVIIWSLSASVKSGDPRRERKEDICLIFPYKLASWKSQAEMFHLAAKLNLELNLWGYLGLFCSLKNKPFLSMNEKELDSCGRGFQWGVGIWLVNADNTCCVPAALWRLSTSLGST